MTILKRGFTVNYDLQEMGLIKPGGHGVIESTGYVYKASLKIKTSTLFKKKTKN